VLLAIAGAGLGGAIGRLAAVADATDDTIESARRTVGAAATAFEGFDTSLGEAELSSSEAADLARDSAGTMEALARAMAIQVFGTQPFLPLSADFEQAAEQLAALGDDLEGIGSALGRNRGDVRLVATELSRTEQDLGELEAAFGIASGGSPSGSAAGAASSGWALFGWLGLQAVSCIAAGVMLLARR
jgi:hypothetical protein